MERFEASTPQHEGHPSYPPSASPLSVSSPSSLTTSASPPIPFSAIQSSSDTGEDDVVKANDSVLIPPPESDTNTSIPDSNMLSERQLIARGRVLLRAYQSQKKLWLQNGEYDSTEVPQTLIGSQVNIFQPMISSNGEYSTIEYSSPTKKAVATAEAPSIDTKLEDLPLPPPHPSFPPPSSIVSGLSNFSIGVLPPSELKVHQPLSGNHSEKSWADFMQLLKANGHTMDSVDAQLAQIWEELVSAYINARGPQPSVDKLSEAVTQLLQQKREAESAIAKLTEVLGSRAFLAGKLSDDAVQFVSNQLRLELEASQILVDKVKTESISLKEESTATVNGNSRADEIARLRQQLQDKEEELQASHSAVAKLEDQLTRQQESAIETQTKFERALNVKFREIDALCSGIELPVDYERIKTKEGVTGYKRIGGDSSNELEDPRIRIALQQRSTSRTEDKDNVSVATEITSSSSAQRPRGISAMAAAPDNVLRRSFSTPHISHDSNVFEDIHVPPDDGRKHTIEDFSTPLPAGWEMRVTASGAVFFFNKYTTTTTWTDPRLLTPSSASQKPLARNSSATTTESRASRSNSTVVNTETIRKEEEEGVKYLDVVFEASGPIGIHFQANVPDSGATVRGLLPDMAAANKNSLQPFDELVAVNKTPVDAAPFRHVMLLLQGGLRPLTLTFKRDLSSPQRPMPPLQDAPPSDSSSSDGFDSHLDEEVLIDEGTVVDLEQLRVPVELPPTVSEEEEDDDMNVADVIITNIFSLFWKSPETTGEVQTV